MTYDFGDVVVVSYPYTNQTVWKQRPAVVVSKRGYNDLRPDVVLMGITSRTDGMFSLGDLLISRWSEAHLLKPSAVKPTFATFEQSIVRKCIGRFDYMDIELLRGYILTLLG